MVRVVVVVAAECGAVLCFLACKTVQSVPQKGVETIDRANGREEATVFINASWCGGSGWEMQIAECILNEPPPCALTFLPHCYSVWRQAISVRSFR